MFCVVDSTTVEKNSQWIKQYNLKMSVFYFTTMLQIICPGGQFECPTGNTCCRLSSGDWGCCPLPKVRFVCPDYSINSKLDLT